MNKNLPDRLQIGAFLMHKRKLRHVKQWWIAKKLNLSESYISKLENGRIPILVTIFLQYCSILELSDQEVMEMIKLFL
ncbi:Helix-turn-helix domain-containing protein [Arachidicoccus rhizosphaerae]|uniref:Helix-turn-helix domain-containing protein n=1 Tax=Arachidicoccus rhizosphaerae TaxID=551991 RepID=A0A1H3VL83_9BACT|nr:Helix-turn-helix domain-containing protein [Arachidicoccus rhizosphaerae]